MLLCIKYKDATYMWLLSIKLIFIMINLVQMENPRGKTLKQTQKIKRQQQDWPCFLETLVQQLHK